MIILYLKCCSRSFQYVPVLETLKVLLKHDDVLSAVCHPLGSVPNILTDYRDGSNFKENPLFQQELDGLQLLLYCDEFEVVNPLGHARKKHKLAGFYYVLGNLPPNKRSPLYTIQLVILVNVNDLAEFGFCKILAPFLLDVKKLEDEGIFVQEAGKTFHGTVSALSGDNLGSHGIGGFLESFSRGPETRLCRFCNITRSEMQTCTDAFGLTLRTEKEYDQQAALVAKYPDMSKMFGIKKCSPLNDLRYFHVVSGLPPNSMHDILEGVVGYELAIIIPNFVDGVFSIAWLNSQIRNWKYGPLDARNKPAELPPDLSSGEKVTMNAGRMWCLIRLLPAMIYGKIPDTNQYLSLLLLLAEIASIVFAPRVSVQHVSYLDSLIEDHHKLPLQLFPNYTLKPKDHYLLHYADMMLSFGPLQRMWCMRFEAKHNYFKRLVHSVKNFKNLPSSLAVRHELMQAASACGNNFLCPDVEISNCTIIAVDTLNESIQAALSTAQQIFLERSYKLPVLFIVTGWNTEWAW